MLPSDYCPTARAAARTARTARRTGAAALPLAALCALLGCRGPAPRAGAPAPPTAPLAFVDGRPIEASELPDGIRARLEASRGAAAMRDYALQWAGVEEVVAGRILAQAAALQGITVAALLQREVDSQVGQPDDLEIRGLYEANRGAIDVPLSAAAPQLQARWRADRVLQLRRALVDRLRGDSVVTYALEPPALPRFPVEAGAAQPWGPAAAPVDIVAFGNVTCPYSAQSRRLLQRLRALYPQQVRVFYRDLVGAGEAEAQRAAEAGVCARQQGKFWALLDLLYENHRRLQPDDVRRYAAQAGLDVGRFDDCLGGPEPAAEVAHSRAAAQRLQVAATPALFLNGMPLGGVLPLPLVQAFVERELAGSAAPAL